MWFFFALLVMLLWGAADLFYKKGADEGDRYSHLKTSMMVGFVMGAHALLTLAFGRVGYDFRNLYLYLPVSFFYIASMTVGYFGLRYLELSISSPIQNASGAVVCILCLLILRQPMGVLSAAGVVLISAGVIVLGVLEKREDTGLRATGERKYRIGFVAFLMPVLYCLLDSAGTFFDAYYLDDIATTPLVGVTEANFEQVANISYELTFLAAALGILVFLLIKKQRVFGRLTGVRGGAALLETGGQFAYVYAMRGNGVVAAPMIAAYCIVSVVLSRLFLKETLSKLQYAIVAIVIAGIILLGLSEGLAEGM